MVVERTSGDADRPFANLLPLVALLVELGNVPLEGGFILDPDGWRCRMAKGLDIPAIADNFELPETITMSSEWDSIFDRKSWCVIEGPGAMRRRKQTVPNAAIG